MIISDEQVRRVVEYLHTPDEYAKSTEPPADDGSEILRLVMNELELLPDVRNDRVEQARHMLTAEFPTPDTVAGKLIGRVLSDSLR